MMRAPALYRAEVGVAPSPPQQPAAAGGPGGGQRMALKLAACQPAANYASSNGLPADGAHLAELPVLGGGGGGGDCSSCSCSSSLDCLSQLDQQQQQHSPVGRRLEPPPPTSTCAFMNTPPPPPHLQHHHQHQLHHQHHQHNQQHHHQQHHHNQNHQHLNQHQRQQQHLNQLHNQHPFHRPLMPHFSVPPYSGSEPGQQAQQQQPPPPTLVRQNTYALTADTITDHSVGVAAEQPLPRSPPPPPNLDNCQVLVPMATGQPPPPPQSDCDQFVFEPDPSAQPPGQQQQQVAAGHKRPTVSFRRAHTADQSASIERRSIYRQQVQSRQLQQQPQSAEPHLMYVAPPEADDKSVVGGGSSSSGVKSATTERPHKSQQPSRHRSAALTTSTAGGSTSGQTSRSYSGMRFDHKPTATPAQVEQTSEPTGQLPPVAPQFALPAGSGLHASLRGCPSVVAAAAAGNHLAANLATFPPGSPLGARAASHLLAFDGISLPAISSHRTNSPWMRISSIILTPIGIVIILFIVVSPLLHYLM